MKPFTRRKLGWYTLFFWFAAAMSVDQLIGIKGLMARHHAGIFAPWAEIFNTVLLGYLASATTTAWWKWPTQARAGRERV